MPKYNASGYKGRKYLHNVIIDAKNLKEAIRKGKSLWGKHLFTIHRGTLPGEYGKGKVHTINAPK